MLNLPPHAPGDVFFIRCAAIGWALSPFDEASRLVEPDALLVAGDDGDPLLLCALCLHFGGNGLQKASANSFTAAPTVALRIMII